MNNYFLGGGNLTFLFFLSVLLSAGLSDTVEGADKELDKIYNKFLSELPQDDRRRQCRNIREPGTQVKVALGKKADLSHWPGFSSIRLFDEQDEDAFYICGGTAVSEEWILTAAHCFDDSRETSNGVYVHAAYPGEQYRYQAVVGSSNLQHLSGSSILEIEEIFIPDDYYGDSEVAGKDIALVRIDSQKTRIAKPYMNIVLNSVDDDILELPMMVAGFGGTQPRSKNETQDQRQEYVSLSSSAKAKKFRSSSPILLEGMVASVPADICEARFRAEGNKINETQICAGLSVGGVDTCAQDSGGPLVIYDKYGCPFQMGIVSFSDGSCGQKNTPTVYTKISSYANFIYEVTGYSSDAFISPNFPLSDEEKSLTSDIFVRQSMNHLKDIFDNSNSELILNIEKRDNNDPIFVTFEKFKLSATSDVEGNLIILDIGPDGEVRKLFPNDRVRNNDVLKINAGSSVTIPGSFRDFGIDNFIAKPPTGFGRLIALVVPDHITDLGLEKLESKQKKGILEELSKVRYLINLVSRVEQIFRKDPSQIDKWAFVAVNYEIK